MSKISDLDEMWNRHEDKVFKVIGDFKYLSAPLFRMFLVENLDTYFGILNDLIEFIPNSDVNLALQFYDKDVVEAIVKKNNYVIAEFEDDD